MSVLIDLQAEVKAALKEGDKERVLILRMIIDSLQKEAKEKQTELNEEAELVVLRKELKRREESLEAFRAGDREDLAVREEAALKIIEAMLPKQMDEAELLALIDQVITQTEASSPKDMGKVMAAIMQEGGVRVDGKLASRLVRERLSG